MFLKNSRYRNTRKFDTSLTEFQGARPRPWRTPVGVIEHVVNEDDRLDSLAHYYYGDTQMGWRILDANPDLVGGSLSLLELKGEIILIPKGRD